MKKRALEGIRVADFSWVAALPTATRFLADFGATVIKIESTASLDFLRITQPYINGIPGINRSGVFASFSAGKFSFGLNLRHPKGIEIAHRLVSRCDIVTESFGPGTLEKFGLDYNSLRKVKNDLIMLSSTLLGKQGPYAKVIGFGHNAGPLAGFGEIVGWPDRPAVGPSNAHTDHIAPWYALIAILAALDYKRRTGKGQYIDMSQTECGVTLLRTAILDYTVNGRQAFRNGNRSPRACPHGVYRCKGDDRWCAIGVHNDAEWANLCRALGNPAWAAEPRFATMVDRLANQDELDKLIEVWTMEYDPYVVMDRLQKEGVRAGVVESVGDQMENDPQMKHRQFFVEAKHPEGITFRTPGPAYILSKTPEKINPPPRLGEHTIQIATDILCMTDPEISDLVNEGVIESG